jgi:hypothetical protein
MDVPHTPGDADMVNPRRRRMFAADKRMQAARDRPFVSCATTKLKAGD